MITSLTSLWNRVFALLGRVSMYRVVYVALATLAVIAFALSFFDLVGPDSDHWTGMGIMRSDRATRKPAFCALAHARGVTC